MGEFHPADLVAAVILGIAALRGLFLGLIREAFSIGALAAAVVAARVFGTPFGEWLVAASGERLGAGAAPWVGGALLAIAAIVVVALVGRVVRSGARAAGLGWADRIGGAALGTAEGAIAFGVLLIVVSTFLGRDHALLAESKSLALLERFETRDESRAIDASDVAAPPRVD